MWGEGKPKKRSLIIGSVHIAMAARPGDRVHREEEGVPRARPEVLFELTDEQMAEVGSPVGTSVLYHFRGGTSADDLAGGRAIVAREGVVMSASMSIHKSIVYQVERAGCDGHQPIVDTVAENDLARSKLSGNQPRILLTITTADRPRTDMIQVLVTKEVGS